MKIKYAIFILVTLSSATVQMRSYHDSPSYVGAIVEYSPVVKSPDEAYLSELNTNNYLKIIEKAAAYDTDIILFPESSLSISFSKNLTVARSQAASYIPDPIEEIAPCDDKSKPYTYSLKSISCAAKKYQIYVVINHREKFNCTPGEGCPADGFLIYNTNVAFNRNGQVIARYRKYNLFGERGTNITEAIPTTFKTDFGVTFGTFICFDLVFETPTLNLTRDLAVTDILFSAHWFSELPYLHSVEAQAAWAYANDVNFLASGFNYPTTASGGGGIYLGKEGYIKVISETKKSNILVVAEIPKLINGKRTQNINEDKVQVYEFKKDEISTGEETTSNKYNSYKLDKLSPYTFQLIDLRQKVHNETICNWNLCCDFELKIDFNENIVKDNSNYYRYRFAVFNGTRSYDGFATGGVNICGIIYCTDDALDSCGHILQDNENTIAPTTFTSLEITMQNFSDRNKFFMPTTFSQGLIPLNATDFVFESVRTGEFSRHHIKLKKPLNNLLTFSIYGRSFSMDSTQVTRGLSSTRVISPILLFLSFVVFRPMYWCLYAIVMRSNIILYKHIMRLYMRQPS